MTTTPKSTDAPVEPTLRELYVSFRQEPEWHALHFGEWCYGRGRSDERSARERKRGERPANPYPLAGEGDYSHHLWERCAAAHVEWASSGDSDELAKLRAELADMIEARTRQAELLVSLTDERDAEKARADRAEANYRFMVERAGNEKLDGYRELGQKAADAENALTQAKARIAELEAESLAELNSKLALRAECGAQKTETWPDFVRRLTKELAEARNDLEKAQRAWTKEVAEANKRITDLEGWHCASVKELAEARGVSAALVEQLRGLSAAHTSTVRDLRDRDHELSLANARGNRLQAQLTELADVVRKLLTERQKLEIEMAEAREELRLLEPVVSAARENSGIKAWRAVREFDAHRAKPSPQSPSAKECNGPGCSYPDGCPKCNPLGTPTQSPSSADSDARECPDCYDGGACLPGGCGIDGCERCGKMCPTCNGSHELPASPPYETAPTLENGEGCPTCDSGVPCIRHLDSRHPGRVVRVESAPANPHIGSELDAAHMAEHGCVVAPGEPHDCPAVYPGDQAESRAAQSPPVTPEPMYLDPALMGRAPKPRPGFATAAELADVVRKLERLQGLVLRLWPFCDESKEIRAEREATKL